MTRPPTRIKVLGQRFTVGVVRGLQVASEDVLGHAAEDEAVMEVLGLCDADAQIIAIERDQGFDRMRETFLHESLHAMIAAAGFRLDLLDHETEERVVKRIAPILLLFLRDNPRAVAFMLDKLPR